MKFSMLKSHLNEAANGGGFSSAYLFSGSDEFLAQEAVKLFRQVLDPEFAEMNFSRCSIFADAAETLFTFPVFDMHRVCVYEPEAISAEEIEKIKEYLSSPAEESILVALVDGATCKALSKQKGATTVDCAALSQEETVAYVRELFASPPRVEVTNDAIDELITRTQSSLARIVSEVQKLKAYSPAGVSKADVKEMVAADMEYQVYLLAEAVSTHDAPKAISMLDAILKNGVSERTLFSAIYTRFRRLLHVSLNKDARRDDAELARLLGLKSTGALYYLRKNAENYSQVRLKAIVDYLHSLQYDTLTGARSDVSVLHEAMLKMLAM